MVRHTGGSESRDATACDRLRHLAGNESGHRLAYVAAQVERGGCILGRRQEANLQGLGFAIGHAQVPQALVPARVGGDQPLGLGAQSCNVRSGIEIEERRSETLRVRLRPVLEAGGMIIARVFDDASGPSTVVAILEATAEVMILITMPRLDAPPTEHRILAVYPHARIDWALRPSVLGTREDIVN